MKEEVKSAQKKTKGKKNDKLHEKEENIKKIKHINVLSPNYLFIVSIHDQFSVFL